MLTKSINSCVYWFACRSRWDNAGSACPNNGQEAKCIKTSIALTDSVTAFIAFTACLLSDFTGRFSRFGGTRGLVVRYMVARARKIAAIPVPTFLAS